MTLFLRMKSMDCKRLALKFYKVRFAGITFGEWGIGIVHFPKPWK